MMSIVRSAGRRSDNDGIDGGIMKNRSAHLFIARTSVELHRRHARFGPDASSARPLRSQDLVTAFCSLSASQVRRRSS